MRTFLTRHSLIVGLALMFVYTWTIDLSNSGVLPFKIPFFVAITFGWGFVIVAVLMTWLTLGKEALVALLLLPSLRLASIFLTSWLTRAPADFSHPMISTNGREDVGGLWAVSTHPHHAGRGVASALLEEAHTRMRDAVCAFPCFLQSATSKRTTFIVNMGMSRCMYGQRHWRTGRLRTSLHVCAPSQPAPS
jgi:GNAT superfamily N-acetyltransferase